MPDWKKIYKPIWVPVKKEGYKTVQVADWKKTYKPVWQEIDVPSYKEIQVGLTVVIS